MFVILPSMLAIIQEKVELQEPNRAGLRTHSWIYQESKNKITGGKRVYRILSDEAELSCL